MAKIRITDPYGDLIGHETSIKKAYYAVEQYFESNISISLSEARKQFSIFEGKAYLPCCMDESYVCTIGVV